MRFLAKISVVLVTVLLSACDFWPRSLDPLAESISEQVSGTTTVWLAGGDVVLINVAHSPLYRADDSELRQVSKRLAEQAIEYLETPVESVVVNFHEGEVSDDPDKLREWIFLVADGEPVLEPIMDLSATGPLTAEEIQAWYSRVENDSLTEEQRACTVKEVERLAELSGDPETLDPGRLQFLPADTWPLLDPYGKRLILLQAISTQAAFVCISRHRRP